MRQVFSAVSLLKHSPFCICDMQVTITGPIGFVPRPSLVQDCIIIEAEADLCYNGHGHAEPHRCHQK
jgi:hypothetical protein